MPNLLANSTCYIYFLGRCHPSEPVKEMSLLQVTNYHLMGQLKADASPTTLRPPPDWCIKLRVQVVSLPTHLLQ